MDDPNLTSPPTSSVRGERFAVVSPRRAFANLRSRPRQGPARTQAAAAQEKGLRFMRAISDRAQAPFYSSAPQPDQPPEAVRPLSLVRL